MYINTYNDNQYYSSKYHYMDTINPDEERINNIFLNDEINILFDKKYKLFTGVCYITEYIVDKNMISIDNICINPDNSLYILCDFNRSVSDIITGICSNYKISLLYNDCEIYIKKHDMNEKIALLNIITLPIFCMIFSKIKFKIYFNSIDEFNLAEIKIQYISITLSNKSLKQFAILLKNAKYIYNSIGHIFEDGYMNNKYNLD